MMERGHVTGACGERPDPPPLPAKSTVARNRTDVMLAVVEMAGVGGALPADEAISQIAALIDRLDVHSESYQIDLEVLLSIGATIWTLANAAERP